MKDLRALVAQIEGLAEKATERPWRAEVYESDAEVVTVAAVGEWRVAHPTPGIKGGNYRDTHWGDNEADARFIAALVSAWPALRAALVEAQWVSVKERLPEHFQTVLMRDVDGNVFNGHLQPEQGGYPVYPMMFGKFAITKDERITHWRLPLSEPGRSE